MGQHFLVAEPFLELMVKGARLKKTDTVLEVGPGLGVLTAALAKNAKSVIAAEKDPAMVGVLNKTLVKEYPNIKIIEGDILSLAKPRTSILGLAKGYKVVANLPYYITSPVIRMFLEAKIQPKLMVLMVQKEVAQRICAKPPQMSLLAISVQAYGKPTIASFVPKNAFWPQPKVDSAILAITPFPRKAKLPLKFFEVVRAGFRHPRKQLLHNLPFCLKLPREKILKLFLKHGISPGARAETLRVEEWLSLAKDISKG